MLIEELKAIASLTSGKQREYFEVMLQGAHTVYCKPTLIKMIVKQMLNLKNR